MSSSSRNEGAIRPVSVYRFPRRALTLCPQLCMGIQHGARSPARSADAWSATPYGHFTKAIYRNRPIACARVAGNTISAGPLFPGAAQPRSRAAIPPQCTDHAIRAAFRELECLCGTAGCGALQRAGALYTRPLFGSTQARFVGYALWCRLFSEKKRLSLS